MKEDLKLNLPSYDVKYCKDTAGIKIFDRIRNKYVALTPEEYVRQHFVNWLITALHYPESLIANEVAVKCTGGMKRCDTMVLSTSGEPFVIVEYKAPYIVITQDVFDQIVRYNMALKAKYLIVSNGLNHYCCVIDYKSNTYHFIESIPDYREMTVGYVEN
jgi:hypothetical protein